MVVLLTRLEKGTTYNAYLIFGDTFTALVDASHEKFNNLFMATLKEQLKKAGRGIDYVLVRSRASSDVGNSNASSSTSTSTSSPCCMQRQYQMDAGTAATYRSCFLIPGQHPAVLARL